MTNEIVKTKRNSVSNGFEMKPTNLAEAMELAKMISESSIVPPSFKGKAGDVLVAIQMGSEVGLPPLQSVQSIAVINGRPTIWGDAALALVMRHHDFEDIIEKVLQDPNGNHRASCTILRKGHEPYTTEFSIEDAKKAGLWGKGGTWSSYPKRMLQMRARGFALRDKFPDALKGLSIREEVLDYEEIKEGVSVATPRQKQSDFNSKADMLVDTLFQPTITNAEISEIIAEDSSLCG